MTSRQRIVSTALGVLAGTVATIGVLSVVAAAFALSFDAIRDVATAAHIRPGWAWMYPVAVDGAMATAAVCAVVLRRMGRSNWYPWTVVLAGAAISVVCNGLHAYVGAGQIDLPAEWAIGVSAVPPLLLALSVHLLVILAEAVQRPAGADSEPDLTSGGQNESRRTPRQRTPRRSPDNGGRVAALLADRPDASAAELAALAGVSDRTVRRVRARQRTAAANGHS